MNNTLMRALAVLTTVVAFSFSVSGLAKPKAPPKSAAKLSAKSPKKSSTAVLNDVTKKYRSAKMVKISTSKKVTSELLGKTTNYEGTMYLSQGKFRWENQTPEQNLLLFDGTTIWNVQYPPKDLGGPAQVAKAKLNKNTKSQILITTLLGTQPIDKNFRIVSESSLKDLTTLELKPVAGDLRVKDLTLEVDSKAKLIKKISYKDDVNNLTVIDLNKTDFTVKENKDLFKFKIPKDAQVTNI